MTRQNGRLIAGLIGLAGATWAGAAEAQPPPPPPEPAPAPYPTYEPPSYAPTTPQPPAQAYLPGLAAGSGYGPPPPRPAAPRVVYGWDPDLPPPDGYDMDGDVNMALVGTGIGLFASSYITSVLIAVVATQVEDVSEGPASDWSPLYVPVAGPFVALGTLDPGASGVGLLLADGIFQSAGVLAIVLGVLDQEYKLIRTGDVEITPSLAPNQQGLVLRGAF